MPQKSTLKCGAITSGTVLPAASAIWSLVGLKGRIGFVFTILPATISSFRVRGQLAMLKRDGYESNQKTRSDSRARKIWKENSALFCCACGTHAGCHSSDAGDARGRTVFEFRVDL